MELVAGDIGGTKSWLAWVGTTLEGPRLRHEQVYRSTAFASAEALLRQFVQDAGTAVAPEQILLALPGALDGQRTALTNLPWTVEARALQEQLGVATVRFINDFQAAAAGVATLGPTDLLALNPATADADGLRAVTGAGTGLGLAFMMPTGGGGYRCFASEGGHIDFAPADARQMRLLEQLRGRYGHVSWERLVSGSAMDDLYRFCCAELGCSAQADPVDGVALSALDAAGDPAASAALDLFVRLYGAWVGNVALMAQPRGGLYIAGGVATHLQARMRAPAFMAAATDKGRMRGVVERTPIYLITCTRLGLQGAIASAIPAGHDDTAVSSKPLTDQENGA